MLFSTSLNEDEGVDRVTLAQVPGENELRLSFDGRVAIGVADFFALDSFLERCFSFIFTQPQISSHWTFFAGTLLSLSARNASHLSPTQTSRAIIVSFATPVREDTARIDMPSVNRPRTSIALANGIRVSSRGLRGNVGEGPAARLALVALVAVTVAAELAGFILAGGTLHGLLPFCASTQQY